MDEPNKAVITYAPFWRRVLATLFDSLTLSLLDSLIFTLVLQTNLPDRNTLMGNPALALRLASAELLIALAYYSLMESSRYRATLGKQLLGLAVTTATGETLSWPRAFVRYLCKLLSALPVGIGFIVAAFTKKHQALHDLMAKTVVVQI